MTETNRGKRPTTKVNSSGDDSWSYFQGVTGGALSVAGGTSTVLKSAGLTISAHARYFTRIGVSFSPLLS